MVWRARASTKPAWRRRARESASASPSPSSGAWFRWTGIGHQAIGPAGDAEAPAGFGEPVLGERGVVGLEKIRSPRLPRSRDVDAAGRGRRCGRCASWAQDCRYAAIGKYGLVTVTHQVAGARNGLGRIEAASATRRETCVNGPHHHRRHHPIRRRRHPIRRRRHPIRRRRHPIRRRLHPIRRHRRRHPIRRRRHPIRRHHRRHPIRRHRRRHPIRRRWCLRRWPLHQ